MSSLGFKEKVIGAADKRSDYWAEQVKCRLSIVTDLVAADGIYHFDCYMKFFLHISPRNGRKRGPPTREYTTAAMEDITSFLESNDECQHTMTELMSAVRGEVPSEKHIKRKLMEIYGDRIILTDSYKGESVICFLDTGRQKLAESWYEEKKQNEREEKIRIVKTAADLVREEIQSRIYNTGFYPPSDSFLENAEKDVSGLLLTFLNHLTRSKRSDEKVKKGKKMCCYSPCYYSYCAPSVFCFLYTGQPLPFFVSKVSIKKHN